MPDAAATAVHDETPVGPVTTLPQVTVAEDVQLATPTGLVHPQVVVV